PGAGWRSRPALSRAWTASGAEYRRVPSRVEPATAGAKVATAAREMPQHFQAEMVRYQFLRSAAIAFVVYGLLGLFIAAAMLVVGISTFGQVLTLQTTLESERVALVQSIRTVSGTLRDT